MKIILATQEQVDTIWSKLQPQERFMGPGENGLWFPLYQALIVVDDNVEIGSIKPMMDPITREGIKQIIREKKYFEVG